MAQRTIGIIMNGVTGRMGTNQHLARSIVAIRKQGGVKLANGDTLYARSDSRRTQRKQAASAGQDLRHRALEHRPQCLPPES